MSSFSGKTFIIARHEFLKTITRKEFLLMTFIFPLFFTAITIFPTMLAGMIPAEDQKIGYVDMTGSFELSRINNRVKAFPQALLGRKLQPYLL